MTAERTLTDSILFGGDYNPEQWPEEVWADDLRLMREAGVTLVTVGVFSWARLQSADGSFDFGWLDRVLDGLHGARIRVDLATATASCPPWLTAAHPEMLPVTREGVRLSAGSRQAYCPSSPVYREATATLVTALVERYAEHPAVAWWHINNEYGCHVSRCYCEVSAAAFRTWLARKYETIDALNAAWGTAFWSQHYTAFDEIEPPRAMPTTPNPTQTLDFDRFSSDELLDCFRAEAAIVRAASDLPVTTNFMGLFKPLDYWRWAAELDFISDDTYADPADPASPALAAMAHDLSRSLGGGRPWVQMEQATAAVNWRPRNVPKAPGANRAGSYSIVARGADAVLYFQWRQSVAGAEQFHSAMLPHAGEHSRIFTEVRELGAELPGLDALVGTRTTAHVAIVLDWDSWWALEQQARPAQADYLEGLTQWYRPLFDRNVTVDFVPADGDLAGYALVIVPRLFVLPAAAAANLIGYAERGGTLVVTNRSGIVDEDLHLTPGGYAAPLAEALGIRIEEFWPLAEAESTAALTGELGPLTARDWTEAVEARGADVLAAFADGVLGGRPAITRRSTGAGAAWYLAADLAAESRGSVVDRLLADAGVPRLPAVPAQVELVQRGATLVAINRSADAVTVQFGTERLELAGYGVALVPTAS